MTTTNAIQVGTHRMTAMNGRHIRIATKVTLSSGLVVRFVDRLSKREAIRQAHIYAAREGISL